MARFRIVTPAGASFTVAGGGYALESEALEGLDAEIVEAPTDEAGFIAAVERAKEYIRAGDCFQVVPSQRFSVPFALPPFALYRALRRINPAPFLFFFDYGGFAAVGASPEILVRLRDGTVTIRPLAGTRRECREELDVELSVGRRLWEGRHTYPDLTVELAVYAATLVSGEPKPLGAHQLAFHTPTEMQALPFCEADVPLLDDLLAGRLGALD